MGAKMDINTINLKLPGQFTRAFGLCESSMKKHYDALMKLLRPQAGAYGIGVEYADTMVHHAPQSAQKPQIVPKKVAGDGRASARGITPVALLTAH